MAPNEIPKRRRGRPSTADTIVREAEANTEDELLSPEQVQKSTLTRKRGRPSKANEIVHGVIVDADVEDELLSPEQLRPKKRGRKSNAELLRGDKARGLKARDEIASSDELDPPPSTEQPTRRHRNPLSGSQPKNNVAGEIEAEGEPPARRKRGRPSYVRAAEQIPSADELETPVRDRPGRSSQVEPSKPQHGKSTVGQNEIEEQMEEPATRRKRGRPSNAERAQLEDEEQPSLEEPPTRKRTKRQKVDEVEEQAVEKQLRRKRGRPSNAERAQLVDEEQPSLEEPPTRKSTKRKQVDEVEERFTEKELRRKRGRPSNADRAERLNGADQIPEEQLPRRRKSRQIADEVEVEKSPIPRYRHLAIVHRNVPRHTIDTKWSPLPNIAVERVGQIFLDVERAVVERIQNDGRRSQARMAVQISVQKMMRKLRKLPFPPSTKSQREIDFDLEKTLDSSNLLDDRLTPLLHSIDLLKAETRKEERLLDAETTELEKLEFDAKAETTRRSQAAKKLHTVLRDSTSSFKELGMKESLVKVDSQRVFSDVKTSTDEELKPVIEELSSHLDSMQNNVAQVEGLGVAMSKSRAAVQDVLFRHLDTERYEHVVLG